MGVPFILEVIAINKVFLIGRVCSSTYITGNGITKLAMFTLKVSSGRGLAYIRVVGFRTTADFIERNITPDKKLYVEGRLNKIGNTQELEVIAENIEFVESKKYEIESIRSDYYGNSFYSSDNGYFT